MNFEEVLESFYQEGLQLDPITATFSGDDRYNDLFPNFLSEEYQEQVKEHYNKYLKLIKSYPDQSLNESQQLSKAIIQWECEIGLEDMKYNKDLNNYMEVF